MSTFDVFLRGIRPERLNEAEQINKKASHFLKIEVQKLEELWSTPNGLCIRRNISGEDAEKIQTNFAKAGLICIYKPAILGVELAIAEKKEDSTRIFTCPSCHHKVTLDEDEPEPVKCSKCFINIAKYQDRLKEKEERDEIKRRLIKTKSATELRDEKLREEEAARKRRQQLEEEISEELFGTRKKKLRNRLILAGCASFVFVSSGIGYAYLGSHKKHLTVTISGDAFPTLNVTDRTEWQQSLEAGREQHGSEQELTPGQKALQDNFEHANKVLNAFGLDAKALAGNSSKKSARLSSVSPVIAASPAGAGNPLTPPAQKNTSGTNPLLQTGVNTQDWDLYLIQGIENLINRNSFTGAFHLGQYISDTETYINVMGQLLAFVQHEKQPELANNITVTLESKINSLPVAEQAVFFAQAGLFQTRVLASNAFFNRADEIWQQLNKPEDLLNSAVKIAVYYFKAGNLDKANHYFSQINGLLNKIQLPDQQVISRANIAKAYHNVGDDVNAANWLASADKFISQISPETYTLLVETYASVNQFQMSLIHHVAEEKQGELLFTALKGSLKSNLVNNAMTINESINDPVYKALGYDLIASYDPGNASQFLSMAEKSVLNINSPADKAIVASQISRQYAKIANTQKAAELLSLAEQQINTLPESPLKDDVIAIAAKNYAQFMQFDTANKFAAEIKSPTLKVEVNNDIIHLKMVEGLMIK